ncbi:MAG: TRAP transporter small permease [Burkholderiaceae bacterium]|nr:TRAP transporter small permease [Burkholderiaceae bacterium]
MKTFENTLMALNRGALMALLAAMALIIFANVVLRYTTSQSIEWAEEVARYMMVWLTFLGAGPVLRYGGHIAVENLQDSLPLRWAQALRALIALMLFVFFGFIVYAGMTYVGRVQYQMTPTTQVSMSWVYASMPVGGVLLFAHWMLIVRDYVRTRTFASDDHFDANASASL